MDWVFGLQVLLITIGAVTVVFTLFFVPAIVADRYGDDWGITVALVEAAVVAVFLFGSFIGGRI